MFSEFVFSDPPFLSCHAATITETRIGLLTAWFAGKFEGHEHTGIWISAKTADLWTIPIQVANGKQASGRSYACWNPVLYQATDGQILLFYKVGKSPSEWRGMLKSSHDDGKTWAEASQLPGMFYGPTKNKPIRLSDGKLLCPSSDEQFNRWSVHFELMSDSGWERVVIPGAGRFACIQPTLLKHAGQTLQALCRTANDVIANTWSDDEGKTWTPITSTGLPNPNSGIDAASVHDCKHVLVYNDTREGRSSLAVATTDDGKKWTKVLTLEDKAGEYSYPSIIRAKDGRIHIVYTWNRKNIRHVLLDERDGIRR